MWFDALFGQEEGAAGVRDAFMLEGTALTAPNGRRFGVGTLTMPTLEILRSRATPRPGQPTLVEQVADVTALHADPAHAGATFQVASQFNLLEMPSPDVTPEAGITGYAYDRTQGPACALAAAAATLYRNSFVPIGSSTGQTRDRQLDLFEGVGALLSDGEHRPYRMVNGYALFDPAIDLAPTLATLDPDKLRRALRVGCHADVEVTLPGCGHPVTQVFGSALPLAYMRSPSASVVTLAGWVLEASYEATLRLAAENASRTGNERVFLTLLGGGVFGNPLDAILEAIVRACRLPGLGPLDVRIVSYRRSDPDVAAAVLRSTP